MRDYPDKGGQNKPPTEPRPAGTPGPTQPRRQMGAITLREFIEWCGKVQRDKKWPDRKFGEEIALMHSELSEALEEHRNGRADNETYWVDKSGASITNSTTSDQKPEGIPTELADCVIRIFAWADNHNVNMEWVLKQKMDYNETREVRHGGKLI
jgi:hypothetical protein